RPRRRACSRANRANYRQGVQPMKTLLITGAAGDIGTHLRRELADAYNLRLSDVRPIQALGAGETFVQGDIAQLPDMLRVTAGAEAILHLGGVSAEAGW